MDIHVPKIIGLKDKDFQFEDEKYTVNFIADKLKDGWIIIMGDMETIEMIERIVYTPGTSKNKDFAFVMGKILPDDKTVGSLFLAKKTDLLKERIIFWCNINEYIYDKLVMINIVGSGEGVVWDYSMRTGNDSNGNDSDSGNDLKFYDAFAEAIVRNVLKMDVIIKDG